MNEVTLLTARFPFITKAIRELLLDNGCVNRHEPGIDELAANVWAKLQEHYPNDSETLGACEAELAAFTQSEFEVIVLGPHKQSALQDELDVLLNNIFESL